MIYLVYISSFSAITDEMDLSPLTLGTSTAASSPQTHVFTWNAYKAAFTPVVRGQLPPTLQEQLQNGVLLLEDGFLKKLQEEGHSNPTTGDF